MSPKCAHFLMCGAKSVEGRRKIKKISHGEEEMVFYLSSLGLCLIVWVL